MKQTRERHGMKEHPAYTAWINMRNRCSRAKIHNFHNYGGRGISVCETWKKFSQFWKDVGSGWAPGLTLDRLDVNGNYSPENCRWVDNQQQARTKRKKTGTSSVYRGVSWYKSTNKWRAAITFGPVGSTHRSRTSHLGYFSEEFAAARAYDDAARKYFGGFAYVNFPKKKTNKNNK